MEDEEYLDASNPVHLWTLHFVFLPQLNQALQHFQVMWNSHPLRTPGLRNKSPKQLFIQGIMEARQAGWAIMEGDAEFDHDSSSLRNFSEYGADFDGLEQRERRPDDPHVHISALAHEIPPILLDKTVQTELRARLPDTWPPPDDMGVSIFHRALLLVNLLLQSCNAI
ncbi:hypothetical protein CF326_g8482 [Tilletia indica]|nr:hypothetical protein CF326_g8482 [Tilletia indica]